MLLTQFERDITGVDGTECINNMEDLDDDILMSVYNSLQSVGGAASQYKQASVDMKDTKPAIQDLLELGTNSSYYHQLQLQQQRSSASNSPYYYDMEGQAYEPQATDCAAWCTAAQGDQYYALDYSQQALHEPAPANQIKQERPASVQPQCPAQINTSQFYTDSYYPYAAQQPDEAYIYPQHVCAQSHQTDYQQPSSMQSNGGSPMGHRSPSPSESTQSTISQQHSPLSSTFFTNCMAKCANKTTKRRRNKRRKGKLWEFLRDLLLDEATNPSVIQWQDESIGVFKIVNSERVAQLWGERKSNPTMTYDKLSRALRYYYDQNILEKIDGQRLIYKFGDLSEG